MAAETDVQEEGRRPETAASPGFDFEDEQTDISDFKWMDIAGFLVFWGLAIIVFLQFFTRYVLNDSLAWTEELARYVLIVVSFAGAVTVARKGTHIFLEFLYRYLPPRIGKVLSIVTECISGAFYLYMCWVGIQLALKTRTKMASVEIPKSIVYWAVALCLGVMAVHSFYWLIHKIRQSPSDVLKDIEEHAVPD
jgi:TRAP-type C4-dicarboxylate transport system permease small subunit